MATFTVEAKNQLDIGRKPRVYFTCHPDDFDKYFNKIRDDIFRTHDCAIYYTEDMTEKIEEEEKETDLYRNNLFVVPVTYRLLSSPNRAMDEDIPYALEKHIPLLPVMMEAGIDGFYADKFGELQYLNPFSTDSTEISYEEKLRKYLESVLISDETAKRIRAAFDAYIFLSYRKKDRRYANELMRLIHSIPECRDIAIWFDEFLTPGESFKTNIEKILNNSKLFTLLVTPSLLEEPDGKPNFVMGQEYPEAKKSGIDILPAEMEETDKEKLTEKFEGIPDCIKPEDEEFRKQFIEAASKIATESNNTPEHNFLIGLAYLDGIDVEVNRELAIELITGAAEAGLIEAMKKLYNIYFKGIGTNIDYRKAVRWAQEIYNLQCEQSGQEHPDTLKALNNLALTYNSLGNDRKAMELQETAYTLRCRVLGEEHHDTLASLSSLAVAYGNLGNHKKATELLEKVYLLLCKMLGQEHPHTLTILSNLAAVYSRLGDSRKALELQETAYTLRCRVLGEEHPDALLSLNNLAATYIHLNDYEKALQLNEKAYNLHCKVLGEKHPHTLTSLNNLAVTYSNLNDHKKALQINEKVYNLCCKVLGEGHPDTLTSLFNIASTYERLGDPEKALVLKEKAYRLNCRELGEEHPYTLRVLFGLAITYGDLGNYKKALPLIEKVFVLQCKVLGEEHPDAMNTLSNFAYVCNELGDYRKSAGLRERLYAIQKRTIGQEHQDTLTSLFQLSFTYKSMGNSQKAAQTAEKVYELQCKLHGEEHPDTLTILEYLALTCKELGDYRSSAGYREKLYKIRARTIGEDHPDTIKALNNLAVTYGYLSYTEISQAQKAIELGQKNYELHCKAFGENHESTLQSLSDLAAYFKIAKNFESALHIYEKLCAQYTALYGIDHPVTLRYLRRLQEVRSILQGNS